MPKVVKLGSEDINWGHSASTRISRLDPSTVIDTTNVNARHVPYSGLVTSGTGNVSTVAGGLDLIARVFSGAVCSGLAGISGVVLSNYIANQQSKIGNAGVTGSGLRMDAGATGFSGWQKQAVSTALSSIRYVTVTPVRMSGWFNTDYSGVWAELATASISGHCLDLYRHCIVSGGTAAGIVTSCGVSGIIHWFTVGI